MTTWDTIPFDEDGELAPAPVRAGRHHGHLTTASSQSAHGDPVLIVAGRVYGRGDLGRLGAAVLVLAPNPDDDPDAPRPTNAQVRTLLAARRFGWPVVRPDGTPYGG